MKRTIIRTLGTFMAVFAGLISRDGNSNTIGRTKYVEAITGAQSSVHYTMKNASALINSCTNYVQHRNDGAGVNGEGTPYINCTGNTYTIDCQWCSCELGYDTSPCGNGSSCDGTGITCVIGYAADTTSNVAETLTGGTVGGTTSYRFDGCVDNAYQSKTSSPCTTSVTTDSTSKLSGCCSACPTNAQCDGSETWLCKKSYYWDGSTCNPCPSPGMNGAASKYDIESCFIYHIGTGTTKRWYDDSGYFDVSENCHYSTTKTPTYQVLGAKTPPSS